MKKAPQFILKETDGKDISLKDFTWKNIVLYFYPRDNTSGCTTEATEFRNIRAKGHAKKVLDFIKEEM